MKYFVKIDNRRSERHHFAYLKSSGDTCIHGYADIKIPISGKILYRIPLYFNSEVTNIKIKEILLPARYTEKYGLKDGEEIELSTIPNFKMHVGIYKIEYISNSHNIVYISINKKEELEKKLNIKFKNKKSIYFEIISEDGSNMLVEVKVDNSTENKIDIRMTRYSRILLSLENVKNPSVCVFPYNYKPKFSISHLLLKLILGEKKIYLKTIHPHDHDEGNNIARLSKSNFKLLGIDEGEYIIIAYGMNKISLQAFIFDDEKKENFHHYSIGIPANIRTKLNLRDVGFISGDCIKSGTVVEVVRDNGFILKKYINKSIMPLVGLILTIIIATPNLILRIIAGFILGIILFLLSLSEKKIR
ncbi:MAG: hypothetical protein M1576_00100 [Deltaproteobacteria bacterium]|nr:hypothetical protein [Deltaproteobacteria bacterium]